MQHDGLRSDSLWGFPASARLRQAADTSAVAPCANGLAFLEVRAEPQDVPVGIADVQLARAPRVVGWGMADHGSLGAELVLQGVRVLHSDPDPGAGVALIADAEHQRGLSPVDGGV